jgi:hypothetical protein
MFRIPLKSALDLAKQYKIESLYPFLQESIVETSNPNPNIPHVPFLADCTFDQYFKQEQEQDTTNSISNPIHCDLHSVDVSFALLDAIPIFIAQLGEIQLFRRADSGYINATLLLQAGGIKSERERSIILSLEVGRVRMKKPDKLAGIWIPLERARALADTCSLTHKLGIFLSDQLNLEF